MFTLVSLSRIGFCPYLILIFLLLVENVGNINIFSSPFEHYDRKYGYFSESQRVESLRAAKEMFYFGYDNYMKHAFPKDELDPIHCTGRGPDHANPSNININDVLGDYALTLVDSLDTLAIMGNVSEFQRAVKLVIDNVSFDNNSTVQVFEATIRVMGALLSAHMIAIDPAQPFGNMRPPDYDNDLLNMAHDLATRLMPAFQNTATGIPFPRVNLKEGVPKNSSNETCTAGAGTLLLEFGILSHLLEDPVYEAVARRSMDNLWYYRSNVTGLFGNVIDIQTGEWKGRLSGLGAGLDSFFEYMLKSFILFGKEKDYQRFNETYEIIKYYMRKGRTDCNAGSGFHPIYVNVDMKNGNTLNNWVDSLEAAWPGLQVLVGDVEEAICMHALYYTLWQRYGGLPERYNWHLKVPEVYFYPLRPELVESTYMLYQATKNPFYLHVGTHILHSLNNYTKTECGYATVHDVRKKNLEDRMESFFLSETCKYLYLLFDKDNPVNLHTTNYIFSTEGHLFPILKDFRNKLWEDDSVSSKDKSSKSATHKQTSKSSSSSSTTGSSSSSYSSSPSVPDDAKPIKKVHALESDITVYSSSPNGTYNCDRIPDERRYLLPIKGHYLEQLESMIGLLGAPSLVTCD